MILGTDVWEGSMEIDEPLLIAGGVRFMMTRLNSINGVLHKDDNFDQQWYESQSFLRAPYTVYSCWNTGAQNAEWVLDNMPAGVSIIFSDVEITKDDYPAETYAREYEIYKNTILRYYRHATYTGGWFLSALYPWPSGDYWWARYPWILYPDTTTYISWQELLERIEYVGWYPDPLKLCSGNVRVWQCTADRYILPGTLRTMDVNVWRYTLEELENWWGAKFGGAVTPPTPITTQMTLQVIGDGTRVRTGPSIYTSIAGIVNAGDIIEACDIGGTNAWVKIASGPYAGKWIAVQYNNLRLLNLIQQK